MSLSALEVRPGPGIDLKSLPSLPDGLQEYIAFDKASLALYITKEHRSNPFFETWLAQANSLMIAKGKRIAVSIAPIHEIAELRAQGQVFSANSSDDKEDKRVREAAQKLIRDGAEFAASDLHLILRGTYAEAQIRIKGRLYVLERMTNEQAINISRSIFQSIATSKDRSYVHSMYQNAQISGDEMLSMGLSSVRVARAPAYPEESYGGALVMRYQYHGGHHRQSKPLDKLELPSAPEGSLPLLEMGYLPKQVEWMKFLARCTNGLILLTGPMGTGKTTTLYEILKHKAREQPGRRLMTIEDPVEYPMGWAVQMSVTNATGEEQVGDVFADRLRSILRMDADDILFGEIRGAESALAAFNAALIGRQVWSTLHVSDPFKTIGRFELMDNVRLAKGVICDHTMLRGMIAQRLVPELCPECSVPLRKEELPESMIQALETYGDLDHVRMRGKGCPRCHHHTLGQIRRVAVAEVVVTDSKLMRDYLDHGIETARRNHRARHDTDDSMLMHGIRGILNGKFDPRDVEESIDVIVPRGMED